MKPLVAAALLLASTAMADAQASLRHAEELLVEPWIASAWARSLAGERFGHEDRWIRDLRAVG